MLASMLNSHPDIVVPSETWWLPTAYELGLSTFKYDHEVQAFLYWIKKYFIRNSGAEWYVFLEDFSTRNKCFRGAYADLFNLFASNAKFWFNVTTFGEKTPAHTTYSFEITNTFATSKKIIILRDPRDIVTSYFNAWIPFSDNGLAIILRNLKTYLFNIVLVLNHPNTLVIRYEELTADPAIVIADVLQFLELPWSERVLTLSPTTQAIGIHYNLSRPIHENSGNYHSILPKKYIAAVDAVLEEEMRLIGYQPHCHSEEHLCFVERYRKNILECRKGADKERINKQSSNWSPTFNQRWRILQLYLRSRSETSSIFGNDLFQDY